ncbi:MAG: hypothetical protein FWC70_12290, partial [Defluviitaleaceae bacterium]|nr:hypothetical protein [Defluviitaleaceae bacterium]
LLILLTVSFISDEDFRKILEANMRVLEDSTAVRVLGEWFSTEGKKQEKIEIAEKLLRRGRDIHEVAEDTGLSVSKVSEMQAELQSRAV